MCASFSTTPKLLYDKIFDIINTDSAFDYFKTKQAAFYPREANLTSPTMFPWVFVEFGSITGEEVFRSPRVYTYEYTLHVVGMTFADKFHPEDLVFSSGENDNPGIGDIALDFRSVFSEYKRAGFGVGTVLDWKITRTGTPTMLMIQQLMMHEFIRGIQCDLTFRIQDRL